MRQEIENVVVGRHDSLDALVTIFATHLLRNYSSLGGQPSRVFNGGLPQNVWRRVNDFIQANIAETLSLEQLSSIAHLSPSHFTRAFRQSTGQSPHQFVLAVRIAHARKLIIGTDMPFGEIAKSAGFANNSHMTALLKRTWSLTPSEIRRKR